GFSASTLLDCAHKRTKVSHGYVWRFADDAYKGEYKTHRTGKPVTQYSLSGKKIKTFPTMQAAASETGLTSDNIQKNVKGHNKTAGGFVWKFASKEEIKNLPDEPAKAYACTPKGKAVIQYSVEGKKIATYLTISQAAKACNVNVTNLSYAVDNSNRTAGGYVWRTKGNIYRGALAKTPPSNRAKPVTQYDMKGKKIRVYSSAREAAKLTGIFSISSAACGRIKSAGNYIWQHGNGPKRIDVQEHFASTINSIIKSSKAVAKYSLEGSLLKEYPSMRAAAREEGIKVNRISSVINGKSKSAGGYRWALVKK
ncbi:MAG TPA: NUMOD1 domain-containing DNA-binding protein, partial [Ohtaekwangia sp.]|uniref:NUMOD1 domain-containing DNA-binding protein n=1 Tax=Ohtaekwangia sp. TaxID=2066019 RepID=UPI002F93158A